jgi:hypothetical protein
VIGFGLAVVTGVSAYLILRLIKLFSSMLVMIALGIGLGFILLLTKEELNISSPTSTKWLDFTLGILSFLTIYFCFYITFKVRHQSVRYSFFQYLKYLSKQKFRYRGWEDGEDLLGNIIERNFSLTVPKEESIEDLGKENPVMTFWINSAMSMFLVSIFAMQIAIQPSIIVAVGLVKVFVLSEANLVILVLLIFGLVLDSMVRITRRRS